MPTFIVIGPNVWGKGNTPEEARRKALAQLGSMFRPMKRYMVWLVGPGAYVEGGGFICTLDGEPAPIELYRVIDRKQVPVEEKTNEGESSDEPATVRKDHRRASHSGPGRRPRV